MNTVTRLCYISRSYRDTGSAGNKAKTDYEDILVSMGAVNLGLRRTVGLGKIRTFARNLAGVMRYAFKIRRGDIVVLQYPVKKYFSLLCRIARLKEAKTIAFVHDLGSCRRRKISLETEMKRLNSATYVIAANQIMEQWLVSQGLESMHGALGFHDYLCAAVPAARNIVRPWSVTYAGSLNIRKNSFMLAMGDENNRCLLHLYGYLCDYTPAQGNAAHIVEHGYVSPDNFIRSAQGSFGLVWDGESLDACTGDWGGYLALNTPHKCSFYIRAGLPLIVWSGAAVAPEVKSKKIGLAIDSLRQLPEILEQITPQQYALMRGNVQAVAREIAGGQHMRTAVTKAVAALKGT